MALEPRNFLGVVGEREGEGRVEVAEVAETERERGEQVVRLGEVGRGDEAGRGVEGTVTGDGVGVVSIRMGAGPADEASQQREKKAD